MTKLQPVSELPAKKARRSPEGADHRVLVVGTDLLEDAYIHSGNAEIIGHSHGRDHDVTDSGIAHAASEQQIHQLASYALCHPVCPTKSPLWHLPAHPSLGLPEGDQLDRAIHYHRL